MGLTFEDIAKFKDNFANLAKELEELKHKLDILRVKQEIFDSRLDKMLEVHK